MTQFLSESDNPIHAGKIYKRKEIKKKNQKFGLNKCFVLVLFLKQCVHRRPSIHRFSIPRIYRKYDLFEPTEKKNSLARNNHHIINIYVLCLQNLTTCIPFTPDYEHAVNLFFNINYTFCIQRAYINIFFLTSLSEKW